jgi:hypothetical protein
MTELSTSWQKLPRRPRRIGVTVLILFLIYTTVGFWGLPALIKSYVTSKIGPPLKRTVAVADVSFNPYTLEMRIAGLSVTEPDGVKFASVDELYYKIRWASIFRLMPVVKTLRVTRPQIQVLRLADGSYNFSNLIATGKAPSDASPGVEAAITFPIFLIEQFSLLDGQVVFKDQLPDPDFETTIAPIDLTATNLTPLPENITDYRLSLKTESGEIVRWQGAVSIADLKTEGKIEIDSVFLKKYMTYYGNIAGIDVSSGTVNARADFKLEAGRKKLAGGLSNASASVNSLQFTGPLGDRKTIAAHLISFSGVEADLTALDAAIAHIRLESVEFRDPSKDGLLAALPNLGVNDTTVDLNSLTAYVREIFAEGFKLVMNGADNPLVQVPLLSIKGVAVDANNRKAVVSEIVTEDGSVTCKRSPKGDINLLRPLSVFVPPKSQKPVNPSPAVNNQSPWKVDLGKFEVKGYAVDFEDRMPEDAVETRLLDIRMVVSDFTSSLQQPLKVSLALNFGGDQGNIEIAGGVNLDPISADLKIKAGDVAFKSFHPYWNKKVGVLLTAGRLHSNGQLTATVLPDRDPKLTFKGSVSITKMATIDAFKGEDLVKWDTLNLTDMDIGLNPTRMIVKEVVLSDYYARLAIGEDGRLSVMNVLRQEAAEAGEVIETNPPATESGSIISLPPVRIDQVTLQGGHVNFQDLFVKPNYKAEFFNLGGKISGLNSAADTRADVLLEGNLENHAPLEISGKVNPLAPTRFVDIAIAFRDIPMGPFTPYSGKYIGRKIKKGKLNIDLKYSLDGQQLKAENRFFVDDLVLGGKVESPDAVKLPVELALSLLTDRNGDINLDIPIQGQLNDPEFDLAKIVGMVIKNLIVKIITAPFSILEAVAGGGVEFSHIDYKPGLSDLTPESIEKLEKLAEALYERPGLKLEIKGTVNPEYDVRVLKKQRLDKLLAEQKQRMQAGGANQPSGIDASGETISADDFYLRAVYLSADFPKPRDASGNIKKLPSAEMQKLLFTNIEITDSELRHLALARAEKVRNYLVNSQKIGRERVFVIESVSTIDGDMGKEGKREGQAVFKLK